MKVTYVCTDPGVPVFGTKGASIHVQEVVRALRTLGHDVTLIARRFDAPPPPDLVSLRTIALDPCPVKDSVQRERWLLQSNLATRASILQAGECDFIYERHSLWSHAPMETARELGVPGVLEVNAPLVQEQATFRTLHDTSGACEAAARSFRAATSILAVSEGVARAVQDADTNAAPIHVVPNGVDASRFHPRVPPALPAPGFCTIGFVGSLKPWHGVDTLVHAFALVQRTHANTRLLIVGEGPERAALESLAYKLGVAPSTTFTGAVTPDAIPSMITSMDIATAPYPHTQDCYFSPLKLFEYMACARAVVASRTGQVPDIIRHNGNGVLCEPANADSLAEALALQVENPSVRGLLGATARQDVLATRTWLHVGRTIVALGTRAGVPQGAS